MAGAALAPRGGLQQRNRGSLEDPLQGKLDKPRVAAPEDMTKGTARAQAVDRVEEVDVIQDVEVFVAELDPPPTLGDWEVLEDREVEIDDAWAAQGVPAHVSEGPFGGQSKSSGVEVLVDEIVVGAVGLDRRILAGEIGRAHV